LPVKKGTRRVRKRSRNHKERCRSAKHPKQKGILILARIEISSTRLYGDGLSNAPHILVMDNEPQILPSAWVLDPAEFWGIIRFLIKSKTKTT
jgi:hypothetical protein